VPLDAENTKSKPSTQVKVEKKEPVKIPAIKKLEEKTEKETQKQSEKNKEKK